MKVLVTGGAGYVGSTSSDRLIDAGHEVVVYDSLMRGHRAAVPEQQARAAMGDAEKMLLAKTKVARAKGTAAAKTAMKNAKLQRKKADQLVGVALFLAGAVQGGDAGGVEQVGAREPVHGGDEFL